MNSYILTAFVLGLVVCQVWSQEQLYGFNEPACVQKGGLCMKSSECVSFVPGEGLCAAQRAGGYECCYGLAKSDTSCAGHGGRCIEKNVCARFFLYEEATDCGYDEECCIFV